MKVNHFIFLLIAFATETTHAENNHISSPEDVSPVPNPTFSSSPSPVTSPTKSPILSQSPTPTPQIDACKGVTIEQLAGQIASQKHDGQKFNFDPSRLIYDSSKGIWYDDQGGSTCQKNSIATNLIANKVNILQDFNWVRSGAGKGNLNERVTFADTFLDQLKFTSMFCLRISSLEKRMLYPR